MLSLQLFLSGSPRLEYEGQPVSLNRRRIAALLAYLAVTNRSHQRDHIMALMWPEFSQTKARNNLRRELSLLRKLPGPNILRSSRAEVALDPALYGLDIRAFANHLAAVAAHAHQAARLCGECVTALSTGVALLAEEFMAGFHLGDAPAFDDWLFFERESLRRQLDNALGQLVAHHVASAQFEHAIPFGRRQLQLDPLHEPTHRQLMRLFSWSGQHAAAQRQFAECKRLLDSELGVAPESETIQLAEAINSRQLPRPDHGYKNDLIPVMPMPTTAGTLPTFFGAIEAVEQPIFVGREGELSQLNSRLQTALSDHTSLSFITGEAGRGKSALLQAFAHLAIKQYPNLIILRGSGDINTGMADPFLPFRDVLALLTGDVESPLRAGLIDHAQAEQLWQLIPLAIQVLLQHGRDLLTTLIPGEALLQRAHDHQGVAPPVLAELTQVIKQRGEANAGKQLNLFSEISTVLRTVSDNKPLLVILDDLHWADHSSLSLLGHLSSRLRDSRLMLVGAYRPEDISQGGSKQPHPLPALVSDLKRQYGEIVISLDKEDEQDAQHFIAALLDTEPNRLDSHFRQTFARLTKGHPLFTIELLQDLQSRGQLIQDSWGIWQLAGELNLSSLPPRIEGVLEKSFDRLDARLLKLLTTASVEGETFTAELLVQLHNAELREVVAALSGPLRQEHRLIQEQGFVQLNGRRLAQYRFRHNLFQQYLYNGIGEMERAYLHEDVGHALERLFGGHTSKVAVRLAYHFKIAGRYDKAITYHLEAAEQAARLYAHEEAINHYTDAISLLKTHSADIEQLCDVLLRLARIYEESSQMTAAEEAYQKLINVAEKHPQKKLQATLALTALYSIPSMLLNPERAIQFGGEALQLAQSLGDHEIEVKALWSISLAYGQASKRSEAIEYGERAAELARKFAMPEHLATILTDLASYNYAGLGQLEKSLSVMQEANKIWRELNNLPLLANNLTSQGSIHFYLGDLAAAEACLLESFDLAEQSNNEWGKSYALIYLGKIYRERGDLGRAIEATTECFELAERIGFLAGQIIGAADLAALYGEIGLIEQGFTFIAKGRPLVDPSSGYNSVIIYVEEARLLLSQGELEAAERLVADVSKLADLGLWQMFDKPMQILAAEIDFLQGRTQIALEKSQTLISWLVAQNMRLFLPDAYLLAAKCQLVLGRRQAATESLARGRIVASQIESSRSLWPILALWSEQEPDKEAAAGLRHEARLIVTRLRTSLNEPSHSEGFSRLPNVERLLRS